MPTPAVHQRCREARFFPPHDRAPLVAHRPSHRPSTGQRGGAGPRGLSSLGRSYGSGDTSSDRMVFRFASSEARSRATAVSHVIGKLHAGSNSPTSCQMRGQTSCMMSSANPCDPSYASNNAVEFLARGGEEHLEGARSPRAVPAIASIGRCLVSGALPCTIFRPHECSLPRRHVQLSSRSSMTRMTCTGLPLPDAPRRRRHYMRRRRTR